MSQKKLDQLINRVLFLSAMIMFMLAEFIAVIALIKTPNSGSFGLFFKTVGFVIISLTPLVNGLKGYRIVAHGNIAVEREEQSITNLKRSFLFGIICSYTTIIAVVIFLTSRM